MRSKTALARSRGVIPLMSGAGAAAGNAVVGGREVFGSRPTRTAGPWPAGWPSTARRPRSIPGGCAPGGSGRVAACPWVCRRCDRTAPRDSEAHGTPDKSTAPATSRSWSKISHSSAHRTEDTVLRSSLILHCTVGNVHTRVARNKPAPPSPTRGLDSSRRTQCSPGGIPGPALL